MIGFRAVCTALLVLLSLLPTLSTAAVSDWYGTWQAIYTGADSGTCTFTIAPGNATQATVSGSCTSSVDGTGGSGSGIVTVLGALSIAGHGGGIAFNGTISGSSGSGQWTDTGSAQGGSWTMSRTSQSSSANPNQPVALPPTTQNDYTVSSGRMPAVAVFTTATGTLGRASLVVALDLSKVLSVGALAGIGQFAAGYNIYVVALVPEGVLGLPSATWFQLPVTRTWGTLTSPLGAYLQGVAQAAANQIVQVGILQNLDVTALLGSEIYMGYGTSDAEMVAAGRYRGIYVVR